LRQSLLVLLLQEGVGSDVVATDGSRLPTSIIARWVCGVELELAVFIIACEEEGSAEGPGSSDLGVVLLDVADVDDDFLDRDT
jgi:hypothetical protein